VVAFWIFLKRRINDLKEHSGGICFQDALVKVGLEKIA
jgi:hypothetical protein